MYEYCPIAMDRSNMFCVIDDFDARSNDELSLRKGDELELLERDDDFGDGWYYGKHLRNGKTGLFPEGRFNMVGDNEEISLTSFNTVYTTTAPRPSHTLPSKPSAPSPNIGSRSYNVADASRSSSNLAASDGDAESMVSSFSQETVGAIGSHHPNPTTESFKTRATPPPLNTTPQMHRTTSVPSSIFPTMHGQPPQRSISMAMGHTHQGEESPVMNETLSVIDEHITDLNMGTPRSSLFGVDQRIISDSGSEYSAHIDHRLSYINGHETDEEERNAHTESEVMKWTPAQVSEFLHDAGVEEHHCNVFKEQEISGEVLLDMDQATLFMKELDLGLVGRRLRTWHKIKALQEEVRSYKNFSAKNPNPFEDNSSPDLECSASKSSINGSTNPRIPSLMDHPGSKRTARQSRQGSVRTQSQLQVPNHETVSMPSTASFRGNPDSPMRPSAASVRDLNHSRRHSSVDFGSAASAADVPEERDSLLSPRSISSPHKKQYSFDRNWTMGGSISPGVRPTSAFSTAGHSPSLSTDHNSFDPVMLEPGFNGTPPRDSDRGYASGGEIEGKKVRNVLRKRDVVSGPHSRQSSYRDEQPQQRKSIIASRRHSRFGSADSIRDTLASVTSSGSKMNISNSIRGRFSTPSIKDKGLARKVPKERSSLKEKVSSKEKTSSKDKDSSKEKGPLIEPSSPVVIKHEYAGSPGTTVIVSSPKEEIESPNSGQESPLQSRLEPHPRIGLQSVSDSVEDVKSLVASPSSMPPPTKESPAQSPSRTGSTTTSGASKSFEIESTDASSKGTGGAMPGTPHQNRAPRRKAKKATSAYVRGLEKKSPQDQMIDCDYSGWMKKKSPSLMTTWKPRLFVLRGRRLSYYYTENDVEEKGLIDISSHRVLPADNERLTGLHAAFTGAKSSPTSPSNAHTPTINATEAAAQTESTLQKAGADSIFIFKLVPPRTGLSRAVNFTKPTVHYFAVDNITQGRLWMAALMKATIDRDETEPIVSTYQQKTISLSKAKALRHRPPALMGLDDQVASQDQKSQSEEAGLNIRGVSLRTTDEGVAPDKEEAQDGIISGESTEDAPAELNSTGALSSDVPSTSPVEPSTEENKDRVEAHSEKESSTKEMRSSTKETGGVEILLSAMSVKGLGFR